MSNIPPCKFIQDQYNSVLFAIFVDKFEKWVKLRKNIEIQLLKVILFISQKIIIYFFINTISLIGISYEKPFVKTFIKKSVEYNPVCLAFHVPLIV